ncbi:MAG: hypothetical protein ACI8VT_003103 [Saprospiraceae bacterium]
MIFEESHFGQRLDVFIITWIDSFVIYIESQSL